MNIYDLTTLLTQEFGQDKVFYHHVFVQEGQELPVPFIVTNVEYLNPFYADNKNYYLAVNNTVTLHTERFDLDLMARLEKVFNDNAISFSRTNDWDEEQELFIATYTVELDEVEDDS